ncbi:MAG: hypothetical protein BHV69_03000 [Bacteroidales bacterium 52_46]|nr:MAG: hypothetical protein BHV69_03000 [Bacteroidales bacterium 52_46]
MMNTNQEIADFLSENNIGYTRYQHKPIFTVEDGQEIADELGIEPCKTLFLVNRQKQPYMLLTTGGKRISLSDFARQIGSSRLSFASADELLSYLHSSPGAVSPLGLIFDHAHKIKLYIDNDVQATRFIALHPCVNNESYVFQTSEFINAFLSAVGHNDYISF